MPEGVDAAYVLRTAEAVALTRDLVNTPANDLGPAEIEAAVRALASRFGAEVRVTTGEDLLADNFPLIHAVGRASPRAPRLIDLSWGDPNARKVTLVGKGVAFDTGGLDIKPSSGMLLMKKDMGGAANAIGLAQMIMGRDLNVRLRLIIPAVENAIDGSAFRPGDVFPSRKGLTVEIGNTDAEGRLILADALSLADEEAPELLIDFATLTGAARVALGPQLPPAYTDDEALAADLARFGAGRGRPVLAPAPMAALRLDARQQDRRPQQRAGQRLRRLHHRGAVPAALRRARRRLAASRHLRLEPLLPPRPAGRRRSADHPRPRRPDRRAVRRLRQDAIPCLHHLILRCGRSEPRRMVAQAHPDEHPSRPGRRPGTSG